MKNILVFDIGKSNIKLVVLNQYFVVQESISTQNSVLVKPPYPQVNVDYIWQWFLTQTRQLSLRYEISHLSITTHGATAALVNNHGLVLPILDYEDKNLDADEQLNEGYNNLRPRFSDSYSPLLPCGLNLGKQIYWLEQKFPEQFSQAQHILMYPQYWLWKLTGVLCSEVTSLGCHTDLWLPYSSQYSSLVKTNKWEPLFPSMKPAWNTSARLLEDIIGLTGLPSSCQVAVGIHDSNASFARHKLMRGREPFTVISTGTWSILMASGVELSQLNEAHDMLVNVDLTNNPLACARFMGGREYQILCQLTASSLSVNDNIEHSFRLAQKYIDKSVVAVPSFSHEGGPFRKIKGEIKGQVKDGDGAPLASIYCALMLDLQLNNLTSSGDIIVEGSFIKNPIICQLLAQLRPEQSVYISQDDTGTVMGSALLVLGDDPNVPPLKLEPCKASQFAGLLDYKKYWLSQISMEQLSE